MVEIKREGDLATIVTGARIDTINAGEFEKEINPNKNISTWEKIIAD